MYFTVLGLEGILNSNAVAADFAKKIVPSLSFIAPIMGKKLIEVEFYFWNLKQKFDIEVFNRNQSCKSKSRSKFQIETEIEI